MKDLILTFIENLHIVWLIVGLCFMIPIFYVIFKRQKRTIKKEILDKETMIIDSDVSLRIPLIVFGIVFIILGIIVIYAALNTTDVLGNKITGCIFGSLMCIIPNILFINTLKERIKINMGQYVIVLDTLSDKYYYSDHNLDTDRIDHSRWQLYFEKFYKKYDKYVSFKDLKHGDKYNIGDQFYLVFVKGNDTPKIYPLKEYTLSEMEKSKLVTLEDAKEFINLKDFDIKDEKNKNLTNSKKEKNIINKKKIIKDFFNKKEKQTVVFDIFAILFCLTFLIISSINFFGVDIGTFIISIILTLIMFLFFLIMTIVKISYLTSVIKNIKKDKFKVKKDNVVSLNNLIEFKDSNHIISFKFENYKKIVFEDKKDYIGTEIGDEFYLVFVKGEKEPIKVYRVKDSILEENITLGEEV